MTAEISGGSIAAPAGRAGCVAGGGFPELDFAAASIADITERLLARGCVLLRKFVAPERLQTLQGLIDASYDRQEVHHIFSWQFVADGLPNFHEYLFNERHHELLTSVFGTSVYAVHPGTASRRVDTLKSEGSWMPPLGPHTDSCFHSFEFTVNFWIPFRPCGIETSSLGVVCADFDEVMEFVGFTGSAEVSERHDDWNNLHFFDKIMWKMNYQDKEALEFFRKRFAKSIWTPVYEVGDAMMLTNWTLHFTHATAMMVQRRSNVELRFSSNDSLEAVRELHSTAENDDAAATDRSRPA